MINAAMCNLYKKYYFVDIMIKESIGICFMQEVELENNFQIQNLAARDNKFECEEKDIKSRTEIDIKSNINYLRRLLY